MNNYTFSIKQPRNEPILEYREGSVERKELLAELKKQRLHPVDIPLIINGEEIRTGHKRILTAPHNHQHSLATFYLAGEKEIKMAAESALAARHSWLNLPWMERSSIMLKVAQLLATTFRAAINAATMLGQSKNIYQAEIDAAVESIDFLRFNSYYASQIYANQPASDSAQINRMEYRPLEGFVATISPFNFTSIALNLNASPVLMGNTTVWKPSSTAVLSGYILMKVFKAAGLPDGVINFIPSTGKDISQYLLPHPELGGIHFTGSTTTFRSIWKTVAEHIDNYRSYPRLVGETGGKDFIFTHASADPCQLAVALVRGAFEYQGQKCSAASRAYVPKSLWPVVKENLKSMVSKIKMGDVEDPANFMNAVIDKVSYQRILNYIDRAKQAAGTTIFYGGKGKSGKGYFIEPTIILTSNPQSITMEEEIFGPVLTIYVYPDDEFEKTLNICNQTSPYALTGSIFSQDRYAVEKAMAILRYAAGNFYINDKPTGAVVGQQPFGGGRASGTNDKAGSFLNLLRWVSPRTIKENLLPPVQFIYPYMKD